MKETKYKGNRWYKCDLHLHTPVSNCFLDKSITPEQWVAKAIEMGLDCVAVTDHDSGEWIDKIKEAAKGKELVVFPGVEITCDTSKVHLLVLFDTTSTKSNIDGFLSACGVDLANNTPKNVFEILKIAQERNALVIPSHIDDMNAGIIKLGDEAQSKLLNNDYIHGIQIINKGMLTSSDETFDGDPNKSKLNNLKNKIKKFSKVCLTFSDNPDEEYPSKHSINGIGKYYSWVKMDESVTLEGLRQALLFPQRIKNYFESPSNPYEYPELWLKSINIENTLVTKDKPLKLEFSPQLNTIIGGRGTGKSSILRMIKGILGSAYKDIKDPNEIITEQKNFFRIHKDELGVLENDSVIEIEIYRNNELYKITYKQKGEGIDVEKYDDSSKSFIKYENAKDYLQLFEVEQYLQKEIYEIAKQPNALRNRIDSEVKKIRELKSEKESVYRSYLSKAAELRRLKSSVDSKIKLEIEIGDINNKISILEQKKALSSLNEYLNLNNQNDSLKSIIDSISEIGNWEADFDYDEINPSYDKIDSQYCPEIDVIVNDFNTFLSEIKSRLGQIKTDIDKKLNQTLGSFSEIKLSKDFLEKKQQLVKLKADLGDEGTKSLENFEELKNDKSDKEKKLQVIKNNEIKLSNIKNELSGLKRKYEDILDRILFLRQDFVNSIIDKNILKIEIKPFADINDFKEKIRDIIQRRDSYTNQIKQLVDFYRNDHKYLKNLEEIKSKFKKVRDSESEEYIDGFMVRAIRSIELEQFDKLDLLYPEDEIQVSYKPNGSTDFKRITNASAGQKTATILSFMLSSGKKPLLLDQPEDDLDNKLVYDLVVSKLAEIKSKRQIIVVTHNANIPVNADAEYVIALDAESKNLSIGTQGTIENASVKKEICNIMEGGEEAFKMRAERYKKI